MLKISNVSENKCYQFQKLKQNNVSFKSNARFYRLPSGDGMETFTYFFREDLPWKKFIPFIKEHFNKAKKVNVINAACSDGTESFSFIIALKEILKGENYNKFLPVKAYDIDNEILRAANSGYVLLNPDDMYEIKRYTSHPNKYLKKEENEVLKIFHNGMNNFAKNNKFLEQVTYKVKPSLSKEVDFNYGDIFNILEDYNDEGNTILFFRNTLGHFNDDKIKKFVDLASSKLKGGSLLCIGAFDSGTKFLLKGVLKDAGFTEVMDHVYKKDTKSELFIKKVKKLGYKALDYITSILYFQNG